MAGEKILRHNIISIKNSEVSKVASDYCIKQEATDSSFEILIKGTGDNSLRIIPVPKTVAEELASVTKLKLPYFKNMEEARKTVIELTVLNQESIMDDDGFNPYLELLNNNSVKKIGDENNSSSENEKNNEDKKILSEIKDIDEQINILEEDLQESEDEKEIKALKKELKKLKSKRTRLQKKVCVNNTENKTDDNIIWIFVPNDLLGIIEVSGSENVTRITSTDRTFCQFDTIINMVNSMFKRLTMSIYNNLFEEFYSVKENRYKCGLIYLVHLMSSLNNEGLLDISDLENQKLPIKGEMLTLNELAKKVFFDKEYFKEILQTTIEVDGEQNTLFGIPNNDRYKKVLVRSTILFNLKDCQKILTKIKGTMDVINASIVPIKEQGDIIVKTKVNVEHAQRAKAEQQKAVSAIKENKTNSSKNTDELANQIKALLSK